MRRPENRFESVLPDQKLERKKLTSVLVQSRRIMIAVLLGIVGAIALPDINLRPPPAAYVREAVKPSHRASMEPLLELWRESPDGTHFCSRVKSLPGCWDMSGICVPGNAITGIVRTKRSESLLVSILPPDRRFSESDSGRVKRDLPIIVYQVPKAPGSFVINSEGETRSVARDVGYRLQTHVLKGLSSQQTSNK